MAGEKNIKEAINYYNLALKDSSTKQEAAWKLLRAYYFLGCFATPDLKKRIKVFEKAKNEGKSFFNAYPKSTEIAYWYSVNLALWGSLVNPAVALKAGSIKETREIAKMLIAHEASNKEAAARGYQILGKAHQKLPHIVFVSSWVDRDSAEYHLKKSLSLNPNDLATRLFLAEYYKENSRKKEMEELLKPALSKHPNPEHFLEDERNLIKMKKLLN
jgi:tetratricopeptide (TPR) repeat protein